MRRMVQCIVGLAALCMSVLANADPAAEFVPLRFGSAAMDIPAEMGRRIVPLTRYLSDALGRPVVPQLSRSMQHAVDQLGKSEVDIALLTPVAYVRAQEQGARIIVQPTTQGRKTFHLMVMTRDSGPIRSLADLAGKRFAFGDPAAVLQYAMMRQARLPFHELSEIQYLRYHDVVARAVAQGDVDAGVMRESTALSWRARGLRAIYTTPPLPSYCIAVSARLDGRSVERVREAFLKLNGLDPMHRAIIRALDPTYDGFVAGSDHDYDIVRSYIGRFGADAKRTVADAMPRAVGRN
jgi:phosphonate transport system substrate-binding protein